MDTSISGGEERSKKICWSGSINQRFFEQSCWREINEAQRGITGPPLGSSSGSAKETASSGFGLYKTATKNEDNGSAYAISGSEFSGILSSLSGLLTTQFLRGRNDNWWPPRIEPPIIIAALDIHQDGNLARIIFVGAWFMGAVVRMKRADKLGETRRAGQVW